MEYLEAFRALSGDLRWGVAAYIFVSIYATLYLRSPLLSCVGLLLGAFWGTPSTGCRPWMSSMDGPKLDQPENRTKKGAQSSE